MRKLQRYWWAILVSLLVGISWVNIAQLNAQADYTINHYTMHVAIQKDGNAQVIQTMTYAFDDDYHGVFNVQDLRGLQGAKLQQVTTQLNHGAVKVAQASASEQANTYQLTQNAQRFRVKLYRNVSDGDRLRVQYRYRLFGVVTNYADTAELNWKLIGTGWEVGLKQVHLTIQLPAKNINTLQAWTHGSLAGHTQVDKKAGKVVITLGYNPANQFVESHLLFPTTVTPTNQKTSSKSRKAAVQKQEAQLAQAANRKRRQQILVARLIYGAALVSFGLALIGMLWWLRRHLVQAHVRPIPIAHAFDVPSVPPAAAQALWQTASPNTKALSAEILQAAADHELSITVTPAKRQPEVTLTKLKPLHNSFLAQCFKHVTTTETLSLTALKAFGRQDKKGRLNKWFGTWQQAVDDAVANYQDATNYSIRSHWVGFAITLGILSLLVAASGLLISPLTALLTGAVTVTIAVIFAIVAVFNYRRILINTDAGLDLINQINGFRQMLKDIGHFNTAEIGDLVLWEQILPYAAAFGLAQKVTAKLQVDFGTAALASGMPIYYPLFFIDDVGSFDLSGALNQSFTSALDNASNASSTTGGSGGFSGGSSGGFGGGSGGGAF